MIVAAQARATARQMLKEKWKLLLGTALLQAVISVVISSISLPLSEDSNVSLIWNFIVLFITYPLMLGILHINNMVYYRRECSVGNMFDFYRNYIVSLRVIGISFLLSLMMFAVILVAFVPIGILVMPLIYGESGSIFGTLLIILLLAAVGMFIGAIISSISSACCYIALRNRSLTFGKLFGMSFKAGLRYAWRFFCLHFSFIGWIILGVAIVTPAIFLLSSSESPVGFSQTAFIIWGIIVITILFLVYILALNLYVTAANTVFYNCAIDEYERRNPSYANDIPPYVPEAPTAGGGNGGGALFSPPPSEVSTGMTPDSLPPKSEPAADPDAAANPPADWTPSPEPIELPGKDEPPVNGTTSEAGENRPEPNNATEGNPPSPEN